MLWLSLEGRAGQLGPQDQTEIDWSLVTMRGHSWLAPRVTGGEMMWLSLEGRAGQLGPQDQKEIDRSLVTMRGHTWLASRVTGGEMLWLSLEGRAGQLGPQDQKEIDRSLVTMRSHLVGLVTFLMGETGVLDPTDLHGVVLLEDGGVAGTGILESERLGFDLHCCLIP